MGGFYAVGRYGLFAVALVASGLIGACSRAQFCQPPALVLSSTTPTVGDEVTVSSPPASCQVERPANHRYSVVLHDVTGAAFPVGSAPVTDHGQFTMTFQLPTATRPGAAGLTVIGNNLRCEQSDSCPGYGTALTITAGG